MNSSFLNKTCLVDDGGMDGTLNDNFLSIYLNTMVDKHRKSLSSLVNVDLDNKYHEEMIQCKKLMYVLKRATHASGIVEVLKYLEEDHNSLSSLSDVSDDVVCVMNPLRNEFEKTLHQLPLKGFQVLSSTQQLAMIEKLKGCDELLKKYYKHFSEDLTEKSILAQNLQKTLAPDLLLRKEKCDSMMEAISNMVIQESADIFTKTADVLLKKQKCSSIVSN